MADRKKVLLRLDPDVYAALARWAADDLRSVNAQIEFALRRALRAAGRAPGDRRPGGTGGEPPESGPASQEVPGPVVR